MENLRKPRHREEDENFPGDGEDPSSLQFKLFANNPVLPETMVLFVVSLHSIYKSHAKTIE